MPTLKPTHSVTKTTTNEGDVTNLVGHNDNAKRAFLTFSGSGANGRFTVDGTTATTAVGHEVVERAQIILESFEEIKNFQFCQIGANAVSIYATFWED